MKILIDFLNSLENRDINDLRADSPILMNNNSSDSDLLDAYSLDLNEVSIEELLNNDSNIDWVLYYVLRIQYLYTIIINLLDIKLKLSYFILYAL